MYCFRAKLGELLFLKIRSYWTQDGNAEKGIFTWNYIIIFDNWFHISILNHFDKLALLIHETNIFVFNKLLKINLYLFCNVNRTRKYFNRRPIWWDVFLYIIMMCCFSQHNQYFAISSQRKNYLFSANFLFFWAMYRHLLLF